MRPHLERTLMVLGVCLPVPLLAATGLAVPLPATVERLAVALVPWADVAALDANEALKRGTRGLIVLDRSERAATGGEVVLAPGERASRESETKPHEGEQRAVRAGNAARNRRARPVAVARARRPVSPGAKRSVGRPRKETPEPEVAPSATTNASEAPEPTPAAPAPVPAPSPEPEPERTTPKPRRDKPAEGGNDKPREQPGGKPDEVDKPPKPLEKVKDDAPGLVDEVDPPIDVDVPVEVDDPPVEVGLPVEAGPPVDPGQPLDAGPPEHVGAPVDDLKRGRGPLPEGPA